MSHRITTKTEITDRELAINALQSKDWSFDERGDSITVTSGPMANATINLKSGVVSGDTDYTSREALTSLNQAYGEALCMREVEEQGGYCEEREVLDNGSVRLVMNVAFG